MFTDVTTGSNPGGGGCGVGGFSCAKGWDPVTGLGTPMYPALLELALSLPSGTEWGIFGATVGFNILGKSFGSTLI